MSKIFGVIPIAAIKLKQGYNKHNVIQLSLLSGARRHHPWQGLRCESAGKTEERHWKGEQISRGECTEERQSDSKSCRGSSQKRERGKNMK